MTVQIEDLCGADDLQLLEEQARIAVVNTPDSAHLMEIGVYQGGSALRLDKVRDGRRLYLVDNMSLEGACQDTWPRGRGIMCLDTISQLIMLGSFQLSVLHHDADHTAPLVLRHLKMVGNKVVPGGIIALHDYWSSTYPGVKRAWQAWPLHDQFHCGGRTNSMQIWVRDD